MVAQACRALRAFETRIPLCWRLACSHSLTPRRLRTWAQAQAQAQAEAQAVVAASAREKAAVQAEAEAQAAAQKAELVRQLVASAACPV